jgi:uncharacterized protein (TIGR02996 family)
MTAIEAQSDREYLALLESVLANPDDNAPRLIISDWLEEHGFDERAELIRLQCSPCKCVPGVDKDPCDRCERSYVLTTWLGREWGIRPVPVKRVVVNHGVDLMEFGATAGADASGVVRLRSNFTLKVTTDAEKLIGVWSRGDVFCVEHGENRNIGTGETLRPNDDGTATMLVNLDPMHDPVSTWTRGFISSIRMTCDEFMKHAGDLFRRHPITEVTLTDKEPYWSGTDFTWYNPDRSPPHIAPVNSNVPSDLLCFLKGFNDWSRSLNRCMWYDDPDKANASLSDACISHGRSQAGLDPLQPR